MAEFSQATSQASSQIVGLDGAGLGAEAGRVFGDLDLSALYAEAVATTAAAVQHAEDARLQDMQATGQRMREEQALLYDRVMDALPGAVREAAAKGQRVATILEFAGSDKLDEFCYLYMLKGPHAHEHRHEMRQMGVKPLMYRLRDELGRAGFGVHHAWQRATNQNTLAVTW